MHDAPARPRPFRAARRGAVCAGVAAVVLAGSGTAYACTTADGTRATGFVPKVWTAGELAALKAEVASDVAAIRAAKAAELAAIKARDKAAAIAAAKAAAAAKAQLRADLEAAMAKARAEARARAAAKTRAEREAKDTEVAGTNFRFDGRHHCDGDHDDWSGSSDGGWDGGWDGHR